MRLATMRAMVAAGLTAEQILAVAEAEEAARADAIEREKEYDRKYSAARRAAIKAREMRTKVIAFHYARAA